MKPCNLATLFILLSSISGTALANPKSSDLSVSLSSNSDSFFAGERTVISANVSNLGPDNASSIQLRINLMSPAPVRELVVNGQLECQVNQSQIVCTQDLLINNASSEVTIAFITAELDSNHYPIQLQAMVQSSSNDKNTSNNTVSEIFQVTSIPSQDQWGDALFTAMGEAGPRLNQMIRALAAYCGTGENYTTGMGGNCDRLFLEALNGNTQIIRRVLRRLRPREVVQQARTSVEIIATQQANIASRMTQLRAGTANSLAGLSFSANGKEIPLGYLSYLSDDDNNESYQQLVSPWGFFINGQITSGDYSYADARDEGFDFDTEGVTAGIDYRINNKTVIGAALGYANFDSSVNTDAKMGSSSLTFSAYGSFSITDNFYIDARASFGSPDFDQQRAVNFTLNDTGTDVIAKGKTDGRQQAFIVSAGYQFNANGWQLTPSVSAEYYKTQIDAFVETGAQAFNVGFSEQNFQTTRFTAGFQVNKAISLSKGVLIPSIGYELIHENQNGDEFIFLRISGMPADEFFEVPTQFNDGDYSSSHVGFTFVSSNGKQAFMQFSKVFGWDGFDKYNVNVGARFEF